MHHNTPDPETGRREPLIKRPRRHIHHRLPSEPELRASRLPEPAAEAQPQPGPDRPEPGEGDISSTHDP